ncbi:hypothetical protein [Microbacterium paludicola]|uniref:hypothetical protein n=1 Tax=Microbacterium paludicola TaxID=300019 RepID=UPI00119F4564|nr:hypothetical protein [Microbacterium paludicola]
MTSDADDALSWDGDEDRPEAVDRTPAEPSAARSELPEGWKAVGKDSDTVRPAANESAAADAPQPLSTPMLLSVGIIGGVYLLYTVGWIIGGLTLQGSALFLVPAIMYQAAVWAAVLAPALWFLAVWLLTRRAASWVRVAGLIAGAALLVPWPFVMTGAFGA